MCLFSTALIALAYGIDQLHVLVFFSHTRVKRMALSHYWSTIHFVKIHIPQRLKSNDFDHTVFWSRIHQQVNISKHLHDGLLQTIVHPWWPDFFLCNNMRFTFVVFIQMSSVSPDTHFCNSAQTVNQNTFSQVALLYNKHATSLFKGSDATDECHWSGCHDSPNPQID